jgi:hypothetical protein
MTHVRPEDRRRWPRKPQRFLIKFRTLGGAYQKDIADRVGLVLNISKGGLVLTTKRHFPEETLLDIKIPATPLGPERAIQGKVVWAREASESGEYHVGCMFVRIVERPEIERRKFPREPRKLPLSLRALEEEDSHEGLLQDLSQGGIEFLSPHDYAKGTTVQVGFPESPLGGARVVYVEVLRSGPGEKAGWHRLAGRFMERP